MILAFAGGIIPSIQAAEVIYAEGAVQVQPAAEKIWKKAGRGMKLESGDALRTARHSSADIALDDEKKNTVRVDEETLVILNSSSGFFDKLSLSSGKVYANVESLKAGMSFEVSTPSAVVGVRGTGWSVASNKRRDEVAVFKDTVFVRAFDPQKKLLAEASVAEGFKTLIDRFKTPGIPIPLNAREIERWNQVRQEVLLHLEGKTATVGEVAEQIEDRQETLEKITETKEELFKEPERKEDVESSVPEHQY